jgi:pyridoxal phosphate-dependent aminotransferase EpsN
MNHRIYLSPPDMGGQEIKYIQEAFDTNWIAPLGPNVDSFEKELCSYVNIKSGLALSSGTAGIHLALKYLNVGQSDYVFCSNFTFIGTCAPIIYQNAYPVFIDSEAESWNMSPEILGKAFSWAEKENKIPKAVIIVDLYGQSADYEKLLPICEYYRVPVIEDAAEALGATYKDKKCGTFGNINVFSFNGNKIITTSGGGMVVSDDEQAIKKMYFWATQAREIARHYEHKEIGYNYRMSNICAGIGRGQLEVLSERIAAKREIKKRYKEGFRDLPVKFMPEFKKGSSNSWLTVITIDKDCEVIPEDIISVLEKENIESRPVWKPMNMQPVFKDSIFFPRDNDFNIGQKVFERGVCLPSGSSLTIEEQSRIISIIKHTLLK